ncbi:aryl-sulfate sulfotransferase [Sutterella megalosphaeroides]|uniref:Arylsulfatase n=1 Tax=Sutterella megalosphaeroides TaxID=2494234 RepID=A0A2Z6IBV0_9BURK|nr:aryl-sulfate sulfotransferase [Sutterella megalosphaeroides]BBF23772.1 arylsulfatase [Sutterella megalosphaeroides]
MIRHRFARASLAVTLALASAFSAEVALAGDGASGPAVQFKGQGSIGEIVGNPYKIAPLTAVIRNGGHELSDAEVRIVPKPNGQEIHYKVNDAELRTHGGIPVFGLYPDYNNTVEVSYTRFDGKEKVRIEKEVYRMYAPAVYTPTNGSMNQHHNMFETEVVKVDPEFADRLYFINNFLTTAPQQGRVVWNNPMGGALEWSYYPQNAILDTKGEVRWYMNPDSIYDPESIYRAGVMMGFHQNADGKITFGYGQRYAKYDILGREIFNRRLPANYADFSHALMVADNGHMFLRVSAADQRRPDGKRVHTVRDVVVELDENGVAVDDWRLWQSLDPYRDVAIKAMNRGAVCLNIDETLDGKTLSSEELAAMDTQDNFGDMPGVGVGRNWAHVNSVDYDPSDDSIVVSSRNQSAVVKVGRDKKVKWILASPEGWKGELASKVLKPIDAKGNPIKCEGSKCEGGFDWTWTQHAAWRIDEKSDKNIFYLSVFDNGDGRGMEQPALAEDKYSRAVIYRIDQQKMTVEQVWSYGKEHGFEWFSPITSMVEYQKDKDSVLVYSATADLNLKLFHQQAANPVINEFKWGASEPSVEIRLKSTMGYRAFCFDVDKAFNAEAK